MDSIGERLRQARTQRGLSLDDVATRTRISRKYLEAIEKGDRSAVPGGFFYKSFVRQYASSLAANDPDLLQHVEGLLSAEQTHLAPAPDDEVLKALATRPVIAAPDMRSNVSVATYVVLLIVALVGCTGLYMWWHHTQQAHAEAAVQRPIAKSERVAPAPALAPAPATQPHPIEKEPTPPPAAASAVTSSPPAGSAAITLEITATDTTWFSVTADGKTVFADALPPGQTKTFTGENLVRLRVGNAGGLDVKFNGNATPPIGPKGQVRTVVVTPTQYQVLQPPPEE